jgi:predicted DNA-binding transcriptional regulator
LSKEEDLKAFSELRGNTLLVYLCLVRNGRAMGAREVQRKLDFSSPGLATYHLEKLESLHLIEKTTEGYVLTKEVKVGVLTQLVKFGSLLLPRYVFYAAFFSTLFLLYVISVWVEGSFQLNPSNILATLIGLTAILVTIYECVRIWKQKLV